MDTVGVLAHGLDTIYPAVHRDIAVQMVRKGGGLLTEYTHGTTPEKMNFVRRNRIVAGISDACIVVESGAKGGSLITAATTARFLPFLVVSSTCQVLDATNSLPPIVQRC